MKQNSQIQLKQRERLCCFLTRKKGGVKNYIYKGYYNTKYTHKISPEAE